MFVRSGWRVVDGLGRLQIDADNRLPKLAASKGLALMPLLTNLVGRQMAARSGRESCAWSRESAGPVHSIKCSNILRDAKAAGVVVDWEQIDPVYKKDITAFLNKLADALHDDDKELWLCVQPGQDLDYIDFDDLLGKRRPFRRAAF